MHRSKVYVKFLITTILSLVLLATVFVLLSVASLGPSPQEQSPSDVDLFERMLAEAQTAAERQAVAQVFVGWRPQMAEQPSSAGMTIRELAEGPEGDVPAYGAEFNATAAQLRFFDVKQRLNVEDQARLDVIAAGRTDHLTEVISDTHFEVHYTTTPTATYPNDHTTITYATKVLD